MILRVKQLRHNFAQITEERDGLTVQPVSHKKIRSSRTQEETCETPLRLHRGRPSTLLVTNIPYKDELGR